eukprot:2446359-Prymnesium_polylepis.1
MTTAVPTVAAAAVAAAAVAAAAALGLLLRLRPRERKWRRSPVCRTSGWRCWSRRSSRCARRTRRM